METTGRACGIETRIHRGQGLWTFVVDSGGLLAAPLSRD